MKRAKHLSQARVHFATARASMLMDEGMSSLPILADMFWTVILRQFPIHPSWKDDHPWKLCTTAVFYIFLLTISSTLSSHLLCYKTKLLFSCEATSTQEIAPSEIRDSNIFRTFCNILVRIDVEDNIPNVRRQEMMFVRQDLPHSFQPDDVCPRVSMRTILVLGWAKKTFTVQKFLHHYLSRTSSNRVRYTDFFQEEPRNLRFLTKILANCVVEDVSKCQVSLNFGNFEHRGSFFFLEILGRRRHESAKFWASTFLGATFWGPTIQPLLPSPPTTTFLRFGPLLSGPPPFDPQLLLGLPTPCSFGSSL